MTLVLLLSATLHCKSPRQGWGVDDVLRPTLIVGFVLTRLQQVVKQRLPKRTITHLCGLAG